MIWTQRIRSHLRLLVLGLAVPALAAGCSGSSPTDGTVGRVGSTRSTEGARITLDRVFDNTKDQIVTTALTVRNVSGATSSFSTLFVISQLSDSGNHTYTPSGTGDATVTVCRGANLVTPLAAGQSARGCEFFSVPAGSIPSKLDVFGMPPVHWVISRRSIRHPAGDTGNSGNTGNTGNSGNTGNTGNTGSGTTSPKHHRPHRPVRRPVRRTRKSTR